jgi:hypothetical protein
MTWGRRRLAAVVAALGLTVAVLVGAFIAVGLE